METVSPSIEVDAREVTAERLVFVHQSFLHGLDRLILAEHDRAVPELLGHYVVMLRGHHDAEEHFLFPALRAAGRMRSTDVAFLNARAHEHLAVVRLADTLNSEGLRHAPELRALLAAHFADENRGLSVERLCEMITNEELHLATPPGPKQAVVEAFFSHPLIR